MRGNLDENKQLIEDILANRDTIQAAALRLKLTEKALYKRLARMGLVMNDYFWTSQGPMKKTEISVWLPYKTLYDQGQSTEDLAVLLSISPQSVVRQFKLFNWPIRDAAIRRSLSDNKAKETLQKNYGVDHPMQSAEIRDRQKATIQTNLGVPHQMQSQSVKDKQQATNLSRYGTEHSLSAPSVREKIKTTNLTKYGVENPGQSPIVQDKQKVTNLARYGVEFTTQDHDTRAKMAATNLDRYGAESPVASPMIRAKISATNQQNLGVNLPFESDAVREKSKQTHFDKHGVENPFELPENQEKARDPVVREKARQTVITGKADRLGKVLAKRNYRMEEVYKGLVFTNDQDQRKWRKYLITHLTCGTSFEDDVGCLPRCPNCFPNLWVSQPEVLYRDFIRDLGETVICNTKGWVQSVKTKKMFELDIFVERAKIAFEHNGIYTHSIHDKWHPGKDSFRIIDPLYHQLKSDSALAAGIKLYHIWEHQSLEIIKSKIKGVLGLYTNRLQARKLTIKPLEEDDVEVFMTLNHLHGYARAVFSMGLLDGEDLVAVISFRLSGPDLEIARYATLLDTSVQGGFSRLLHHSLPLLKQKYPNVTRLITYADRDWSPKMEDTVYYKCGFTPLGDTGPSMYYTDFKHVYSRQRFQKHKLPALFPNSFDPLLTEQQILSAEGIYPLYTSGNWKFKLKL